MTRTLGFQAKRDINMRRNCVALRRKELDKTERDIIGEWYNGYINPQQLRYNQATVWAHNLSCTNNHSAPRLVGLHHVGARQSNFVELQ